MITCKLCGADSPQDYDPKKKPPETEAGEEAKTLQAAKVNGQGPFCELCRHLEMALRYATARNWTDVATTIEIAQQKIQDNHAAV